MPKSTKELDDLMKQVEDAVEGLDPLESLRLGVCIAAASGAAISFCVENLGRKRTREVVAHTLALTEVSTRNDPDADQIQAINSMIAAMVGIVINGSYDPADEQERAR